MSVNNPEIAIIVAMDEERGIGKGGKLPWHIPADLQHFKELTVPYPVIMGRKTFESLPISRRPLPNRSNMVVTHNPDFSHPGISIARSLEEALEKATVINREKVFLIGGAQIFTEGLKFTDRLYLTLIEGKFDVDVFFPEYLLFNKILSSTKGKSNGYFYTFLELIKE